MFLNAVNKIGSQFGITLKGDVTVLLVGECIKTTLFVKPTDAQCYLHCKLITAGTLLVPFLTHSLGELLYALTSQTVIISSIT